jgi:hypothetical protein
MSQLLQNGGSIWANSNYTRADIYAHIQIFLLRKKTFNGKKEEENLYDTFSN